MPQYIVWNMQYAKDTRMFYYILSHFAVFKPACVRLLCPRMLCSRKAVSGSTGGPISDITSFLSPMLHMQQHVLCKGSCSTYYK